MCVRVCSRVHVRFMLLSFLRCSRARWPYENLPACPSAWLTIVCIAAPYLSGVRGVPDPRKPCFSVVIDDVKKEREEGGGGC